MSLGKWNEAVAELITEILFDICQYWGKLWLRIIIIIILLKPESISVFEIQDYSKVDGCYHLFKTPD